MVLLKDLFIKADFEKNQQTAKKRAKFPGMQRVKGKATAMEIDNEALKQIATARN